MVTDSSSLGGDFGVILTSCLTLTGGIQYGMQQMAEMENWMTSVERILEYGQLKGEEDEEEESNRSEVKINPPVAWPHSGKIEFQKVCLTYEEEGEGKPALNNVSFCAEAGEKVRY